MKILVVGSGGREHALCWRLRQSPLVETVYCAPGNPGIGMVARCIDIQIDDLKGLKNFAVENGIDLTVVGPEYPLTLGIVDAFVESGLRIFGPTKEAAALEGSKSFAKQIMKEAGVYTAEYEVVHSKSDAERTLQTFGVPIVFKADGLAAGKGVFVCHTQMEAQEAINSLYRHGNEQQRVVIEQFLPGEEISFIVATDGHRIVPLAPSHDYKRIYDNDEGPNTGGMGSVCPTPRFSKEDEQRVIATVMIPTINRMKERGTPFTGFLYAGLMKAPDGSLAVLEFNARLGDPETQSIMRRLQSDFAEVLYFLSDRSADGKRVVEHDEPLQWDPRPCVCLVLAAEGYPGTPITGNEISGLHLTEVLPEAVVFHAGTKTEGTKIVSAGGRVLGITAMGDSLEDARRNAYKAADLIQLKGAQMRRDIGLS